MKLLLDRIGALCVIHADLFLNEYRHLTRGAQTTGPLMAGS